MPGNLRAKMPGRAVLPGMITYLSVKNHMESRLFIKLLFTRFMVVTDILATPFFKIYIGYYNAY